MIIQVTVQWFKYEETRNQSFVAQTQNYLFVLTYVFVRLLKSSQNAKAIVDDRLGPMVDFIVLIAFVDDFQEQKKC